MGRRHGRWLLLTSATLIVTLATGYGIERQTRVRLAAEVDFLQTAIVRANDVWFRDRMAVQRMEGELDLLADQAANLQTRLDYVYSVHEESLIEAVKRGRYSHEYYLTHADPYFAAYPSFDQSQVEFHTEWIRTYDKLLRMLETRKP